VDDWARLPKKVVPSSDMLRGGAWNLWSEDCRMGLPRP